MSNTPLLLNKEWEKENCHSTIWAWLIFAGPVFGKLLWEDHWKWPTIFLMMAGVCMTRGFWLKAMALPCVYLVTFGPLNVYWPPVTSGVVVADLYWALAWYIRWYADGQAKKRKESLRDWEGD